MKNDVIVDELIKIVDSEIYSLNIQVKAVDELGETSSEKAKRYLEGLLMNRISRTHRENPDCCQPPEDVLYTDKRIHHHAKGKLKDALQSSVEYEGSFSMPPKPPENKYHKLIESSVKKLEKSLT